MAPLFAFEVWFKDWESEREIINHETLGKACAVKWRRSSDCAPVGLRYVDVRGRKLGPVQDTRTLIHVQEYRGRPDLKAGTPAIGPHAADRTALMWRNAMFTRILVPVDLAEPAFADKAIKAILEYTRIGETQVRLVSVRQLVPQMVTEYLPADFDRAAQEDAERDRGVGIAEIGYFLLDAVVDDRESVLAETGNLSPEDVRDG